MVGYRKGYSTRWLRGCGGLILTVIAHDGYNGIAHDGWGRGWINWKNQLKKTGFFVGLGTNRFSINRFRLIDD